MSENKSFDELLLPVRNDIDRIDKELLKLFTERMHCSERGDQAQGGHSRLKRRPRADHFRPRQKRSR